jgi:hypothetical protein
MEKPKISRPQKRSLRLVKPPEKQPENASAANSAPSKKSNNPDPDYIGTFDELMELDPKTVKRITVPPTTDMGHKILTHKIQ